MSERFTLDVRMDMPKLLIDKNTNEKYNLLMVNDIERIVDVLNEQQATIEQLKAQLREKEEDEKLYANEILELRETNKEHIKFKSLGGNY